MNNRRSFITGLKGTKLNSGEIKFLNKYKPWGVILFTRNLVYSVLLASMLLNLSACPGYQ